MMASAIRLIVRNTVLDALYKVGRALSPRKALSIGT